MLEDPDSSCNSSLVGEYAMLILVIGCWVLCNAAAAAVVVFLPFPVLGLIRPAFYYSIWLKKIAFLIP